MKEKVKKVLIYTTPTCIWCHHAKEFFKDHKVKYKELDVMKNMKNRKEMMKKSGALATPVIDIDGKIIIGFDEIKIRKLLKIN